MQWPAYEQVLTCFRILWSRTCRSYPKKIFWRLSSSPFVLLRQRGTKLGLIAVQLGGIAKVLGKLGVRADGRIKDPCDLGKRAQAVQIRHIGERWAFGGVRSAGGFFSQA